MTRRKKKSNWKTTAIGLFEAITLQISAESLFHLTNRQRAVVLAIAISRAASGYFAKDKDVTGVQ